MIPLILLVNSEKEANEYLKDLLKDQTIIKIFPEGETLKIEQIKLLKKNLSVRFKKNPTVVIWWFDKANVEAQNASLKLLEEYSSRIKIFLIVKNTNRLLKTILSRAFIKDLRKKVKIKEFLKQNNIEISFPEISNKIKAKEFLISFLYYTSWKARFDSRYADLAKEILEILKLLENNNLNSQLSVDYALIFYYKTFNIKL